MELLSLGPCSILKAPSRAHSGLLQAASSELSSAEKECSLPLRSGKRTGSQAVHRRAPAVAARLGVLEGAVPASLALTSGQQYFPRVCAPAGGVWLLL